MKAESVTVTRGNVVAGVAELLDVLETSDAIELAQAAGRMSAFAAILCQTPPTNPFHKANLPPLPPLASVRAKPPEPEQERPSGNAPAPAEQTPPPGEWSEPPGLTLKVLAAAERRPSPMWRLARHLDISRRDVDGFVLRNLHLFEPMKDMRAVLELSAAGRARLAELRSPPAPATGGGLPKTGAA